ncbi:hypothetical protein [Treponema zioleckii]|uniref:hypothetical protein n=1 Tax=Treponema zioleckii TaxID=331680 RepID=UPI00168B12A7|nr:hypothetical protein [Treponema zioleckii]
MMKNFFSKRNVCIFAVILITLLALFFCIFALSNKGYKEQRYEIDYPLLSELIHYYDKVDDNVFNLIKYQFCRRKIINSFFEREDSRIKENYALIYSLENIKTYHDAKRFVFNSEVEISRAYTCTNDFTKNRFFIIVRRNNFLNKTSVFLTANCNGVELEPIQIIK